MEYLPIFLSLAQRPVLVVGGGNVAARKVRLLLDAGAAVNVLAPELAPELNSLVGEKQIAYIGEHYSQDQLAGCDLVIAATNNAEVNAEIAGHAKARHLPVNVVDKPELCSFIIPSIVDRSPVVVAVSTGGKSPVLARLLRARLETMIPAAYGQLATLIGEFRQQVNSRFTSSKTKRLFWERVIQGPIAELLLAGKQQSARERLAQAISEETDMPSDMGEVFLVGAGPGDPDLLTFRALRLMQQADVVLYDRLVSKEILAMTRRDADKIYVGKAKADHAVPQERINGLLVELARQGKRVLRLKGGDPFIFGRGGEEIADIARQGIAFQVVPGITAAAGCAAYAGIPLTHRDYAQSCILVTGHLKDGSVDLNWNLLCQPNQTVVVYMGLTGLKVLCEQMIAHGSPADTPAALIEQGTTREQRVITGTLANLAEEVKNTEVHAPTLIIVGGVVALRNQLQWFEGNQTHQK